MKKIYKYKLTPNCSLELPQAAQVLCVKEQGDDICMWALVDTDDQSETRRFVVVPTGRPIEYDDSVSDMVYLGTASLMNGNLIFHAFELKP